MKKFVLFSLIAALFSGVAMADVYRESIDTCDEAEMRAALDRATRDNRAVITVVECDNGVVHVRAESEIVAAPAPNQYALPSVPNGSCLLPQQSHSWHSQL